MLQGMNFEICSGAQGMGTSSTRAQAEAHHKQGLGCHALGCSRHLRGRLLMPVPILQEQVLILRAPVGPYLHWKI